MNYTNSSFNDINKMIARMRQRFGRGAFAPQLRKKLTDFVNSLDHLHESEKTIFKDSLKEDQESTLSKVTDLNEFVRTICNIPSIIIISNSSAQIF